MNAYNDASLIVYPSGYKESKIYAQKPIDGSGDLTFARASSGTRVNEQGLIETVPYNLINYSQDFTNGVWTPSGVVATLNSGTAPDGTNTLNDVSSNNSGVQENRFRYATSLAVSTTYTISIFCKVKDVNNFYIRDLTGGGGVSIINVATSTVLVTGSGSTISVVDFGSGIKRVIVTFTTPSSIGNNLIDFGITSSNTDRSSAIAIGSGMYFWGAQIEAGSYPTSYIPTSGTTVTRVADSSSTTGLSSVINSEEGVLYAEISALANDGTTRAISISDGTSNNRLVIFYDTTSNKVNVFAKVSNTNQAIMNFIVTDATSLNKIAVKYKLNDYSLWINGVEVDTDISATPFTSSTLTTLSFADGNTTSSPFYGNVQNLMVFPSALDDATLATLTTL
jgi:hypothetical protein